jgi:esterase/lipase
MKRLIIIQLLILSYILCQSKEENCIIPQSFGNLEGTLLTPSNKSETVVLIIAGSGPTDRNCNSQLVHTNSFKMLAKQLKEKGIASLRFDKRTSGELGKSLKGQKIVFDDFINDAKLWLDFLKTKEFKNIIVAGHSQGALIGMILAQDKAVKKYISIAGAGNSIDETLKNQYSQQPMNIVAEVNSILDKLKEGKKTNKVPPYLVQVFSPKHQDFIMSWMKYDPIEEIKKLTIPILIIQGDNDIQVKVKAAETLSKSNKRTKLKIIKGMNHILKDAPRNRMGNLATYNNPNLKLNYNFVSEVIKFIKE